MKVLIMDTAEVTQVQKHAVILRPVKQAKLLHVLYQPVDLQVLMQPRVHQVLKQAGVLHAVMLAAMIAMSVLVLQRMRFQKAVSGGRRSHAGLGQTMPLHAT